MKKTTKKSSPKKSIKKTVQKLAAKKVVAKKTSKPSAKKVVKKSPTKKTSAKATAKSPAKKATAKGVKKKKEDLMCFLTTACVGHYGLPDNCYELETLRNYRDGYLMQTAAGKDLVKDYYSVAPGIVRSISLHPSKEKFYTYIYERVQRSCCAIENKQLEKARAIYQRMVLYLERQVVLGS